MISAFAKRLLFAVGLLSLIGAWGCDTPQPAVEHDLVRTVFPLRTLSDLQASFVRPLRTRSLTNGLPLIRLTIDVQRTQPALRLEADPSSKPAMSLVQSLTGVTGIDVDDPKRPTATMPLSDWPSVNAVIDGLTPLAAAARYERDFYADCEDGAGIPGYSPGVLRLIKSASDSRFVRLPSISAMLISRRIAPTGHPLDLALADTPGVLAFFVARAFDSDDIVFTRDGRFAVIDDPDSTTGDRLLVNAIGRISGVSPIPADARRILIDADGIVSAEFIEAMPADGSTDAEPEPVERIERLGVLPIVVFSMNAPLPLKGDGYRFEHSGSGAPPVTTTLKDARISSLPAHLNLISADLNECAERRDAFDSLADVLDRALKLLDVCRLTQLLTADQPNEAAQLADQIKLIVKAAVDEQTRELKLVKSSDPSAGPKTLKLSGRLEKTREFFAASRLKERATMAGGMLTVRFDSAQEGMDALSECLTILKNILTVHQQNIQNMYVSAYAAKEIKIEASDGSTGGSTTGVAFLIIERQPPHKWVKPSMPNYPGIDETDPDKRVKLPNVDLDSERTAYRSAYDEYLLLQDTLKSISGGWTVIDVPAIPDAPAKPEGL
ncbi:MAG: hypothetical protein ABIH86_00040 [Planctomycetota bacterium]